VLVPIPAEPGPTPAPQPVPAVVEGWVETWDEAGHTAQLSVSDQRRWVTTQLRTYAEVAAGGTYAYWATGSYLDMLVEE